MPAKRVHVVKADFQRGQILHWRPTSRLECSLPWGLLEACRPNMGGRSPNIYSGIFPGWIFSPSKCHFFFLLWWLIMTNFGMSALLSIGCTGQSCLLDREEVSFGPVTSGFLPENHLWIGVMNFEVFTPFFPFCFFFSMLQILSKLSWSFIWHLIIHRKTLFPFMYSSINW